MTKVYLAGPMRGLAESNYPAFNREANLLRRAGYTVINPAEMDMEGESIRDCFRRDTDALLDCDGVVVLGGWSYSLGARAEVALAKAVGMPVFEVIRTGKDAVHLDELKDRGVGFA